MNYVDFLLWVRGPAFQIATAIFIFGLSWRLLEILSLSRKPELAVVRERGIAGGFRTIFRRFLPVDDNTFQRSAFIITAGYIFHLGFLSSSCCLFRIFFSSVNSLVLVGPVSQRQ